MRIIDSRVCGPYLYLLIELHPHHVCAVQTAINRFEIVHSLRGPISGSIDLRIFALQTVPDDWQEQIERAALPAPRKELPKP